MKSNATLLTIITTVSALAIGLLSLSYIAYYSAEKAAVKNVPANFAMTNIEDAEQFKLALHEQNIAFNETVINVIQVNIDARNILDSNLSELNIDPNSMTISVISDQDVENIDMSADETLLTGYDDFLHKFMPLK